MLTYIRWCSSQTQRQILKSMNSLKDPAKDLNNTKLIGTVSSEVFYNAINKSRVFQLKTFNQDNFYDSHKIIVTPYMVENLRRMPKTGQNILVTGKMRTQQFTLSNGKKGTSIQVVAKQIYLCDNSSHTGSIEMPAAPQLRNTANSVGSIDNKRVKDTNKVELFAHICFDILNEETHSVFTLALHYQTKNSDGIDEDRTDFITVFVYNEPLRNIVRNQLQRLDRVRVEGVLKYKACIDESGKKRYKGYVNATKIAKVISLRQMLAQEKIQMQ